MATGSFGGPLGARSWVQCPSSVSDTGVVTVRDSVLNLKAALERHLDEHGPDDGEWEPGWKLELRPPATPEAIAAVEAAVGMPLPAEFREFYEFTNGGPGGIEPIEAAVEWLGHLRGELLSDLERYRPRWPNPELTPTGTDWVPILSLGNFMQLVMAGDTDDGPGSLWILDIVNSYDDPDLLWESAAPTLSDYLAAQAELLGLGPPPYREVSTGNRELPWAVHLYLDLGGGLRSRKDPAESPEWAELEAHGVIDILERHGIQKGL